MLVANSTHTDEITGQLEGVDFLGELEVTVSEPFFEVPYKRDSLGDAVVATARLYPGTDTAGCRGSQYRHPAGIAWTPMCRPIRNLAGRKGISIQR